MLSFPISSIERNLCKFTNIGKLNKIDICLICKQIPIPPYRSTTKQEDIFCKRCLDIQNFNLDSIIMPSNKDIESLENIIISCKYFELGCPAQFHTYNLENLLSHEKCCIILEKHDTISEITKNIQMLKGEIIKLKEQNQQFVEKYDSKIDDLKSKTEANLRKHIESFDLVLNQMQRKNELMNDEMMRSLNNRIDQTNSSLESQISSVKNELVESSNNILSKLTETETNIRSSLSHKEKDLIIYIDNLNTNLKNEMIKYNSTLQSNIDIVKSYFEENSYNTLKKLTETETNIRSSLSQKEKDLIIYSDNLNTDLKNEMIRTNSTLQSNIDIVKSYFEENIKTTLNKLSETETNLNLSLHQKEKEQIKYSNKLNSEMKNELINKIALIESKLELVKSNLEKTIENTDNKVIETYTNLKSSLSKLENELLNYSDKLNSEVKNELININTDLELKINSVKSNLEENTKNLLVNIYETNENNKLETEKLNSSLKTEMINKNNSLQKKLESVKTNLEESTKNNMKKINETEENIQNSLKIKEKEIKLQYRILNSLLSNEMTYKTLELNNTDIQLRKKINSLKQEIFSQMIGFNSNRIVITSHGGNYWCGKSQFVVGGVFEAKVTVIKIDNTKANGNYNYGVGLIKRVQTNDDNMYYKDSLIFYSNGFNNIKFNGYKDKKLFDRIWKTGDIILIKRDKLNNVYFGINTDSTYKLAFESIEGSYQIVFGFSNNAKEGDAFELTDIYEL